MDHEVPAPADLETLGLELEGARAEAERYKDLYLRARADLENHPTRP